MSCPIVLTTSKQKPRQTVETTVLRQLCATSCAFCGVTSGRLSFPRFSKPLLTLPPNPNTLLSILALIVIATRTWARNTAVYFYLLAFSSPVFCKFLEESSMPVQLSAWRLISHQIQSRLLTVWALPTGVLNMMTMMITVNSTENEKYAKLNSLSTARCWMPMYMTWTIAAAFLLSEAYTDIV